MQTPVRPDAGGWTSEVDWDDEVDVLCVGSGPGVLAHAIACAASDADVLMADAAAPVDVRDAETLAYLSAMTEDLGPITPVDTDLELPVIRAEPVQAAATDRRATIEPFIGSRLRDFAAHCVASPFGVLYTQIPESDRTAMRTDGDEIVQAASVGTFRAGADEVGPALIEWLDAHARERGIARDTDSTVRRLIFENGRVAGAALTTPSGETLVRAAWGVAMSTRSVPGAPQWPVQPDLRDTVADVAVVACTAGRFGRVALLNPR